MSKRKKRWQWFKKYGFSLVAAVVIFGLSLIIYSAGQYDNIFETVSVEQ